MKTVRLIAAGFIFAIAFAVSVSAQGAAQPAANVKVMFINTEAFGDPGGITRYVNAITALDNNVAPDRAQIRSMVTRHDALAKEVTQLQAQIDAAPNAAGTPALIKQMEARIEEGRTLETDIKRRQEDGRKKWERLHNDMIDPILENIRLGLQDFAKQRGYSVILDVSKLGPALVAFDPAKADVTKDFIAFYNARPPTAAPVPKTQ
jgi:Skp family chaperone for outer membrane proteins